MNEPKPEDVMRGLECCTNPDRNCDCGCECPYGDLISCTQSLMAHALALLREKDAEIERLKCQVNRLKKYDEERDIRLHARLTETARAEAITEFADKLQNYYTHLQGMTSTGSVVYFIEQKKKEMLGVLNE